MYSDAILHNRLCLFRTSILSQGHNNVLITHSDSGEINTILKICQGDIYTWYLTLLYGTIVEHTNNLTEL